MLEGILGEHFQKGLDRLKVEAEKRQAAVDSAAAAAAAAQPAAPEAAPATEGAAPAQQATDVP